LGQTIKDKLKLFSKKY